MKGERDKRNKKTKGREEKAFEVESRRGFALKWDVKERGTTRLRHSIMTRVEHAAAPENSHGLTSAHFRRSRR
jgi:hypothetical protein